MVATVRGWACAGFLTAAVSLTVTDVDCCTACANGASSPLRPPCAVLACSQAATPPAVGAAKPLIMLCTPFLYTPCSFLCWQCTCQICCSTCGGCRVPAPCGDLFKHLIQVRWLAGCTLFAARSVIFGLCCACEGCAQISGRTNRLGAATRGLCVCSHSRCVTVTLRCLRPRLGRAASSVGCSACCIFFGSRRRLCCQRNLRCQAGSRIAAWVASCQSPCVVWWWQPPPTVRRQHN